jgi:hypothetical protein
MSVQSVSNIYERVEGAEQDLAYLTNLPRAEFSRAFLKREQNIFDGFRTVFNIVMAFSLIASVISLLIALMAISYTGISLVLINLLVSGIQYGIIFYLASLCGRFVRLRAARISNEVHNDLKDAEGLREMAKAIEKKIEERASQIKAGDNAIIVVNSKTGNIEQTITTRKELRDPLALLIAHAEQTGRADIIEAAKHIAAEASKETPDKSLVFNLWNKIVAAIPKIGEITEIAKAIIKMMS